MDLADDLSFGADAHKHGSTPLLYLEFAIYDIIKEDTGIVIGSTQTKCQFTVKASRTSKKSKIIAGGVYPEFLESLSPYMGNDTPIIQQVISYDGLTFDYIDDDSYTFTTNDFNKEQYLIGSRVIEKNLCSSMNALRLSVSMLLMMMNMNMTILKNLQKSPIKR